MFNKYFKEDFILYDKSEILKYKLFGINKNHYKFKKCIGDYIAIATKNKSIKYKRKGTEHLASHSGLTSGECQVPLIIKY